MIATCYTCGSFHTSLSHASTGNPEFCGGGGGGGGADTGGAGTSLPAMLICCGWGSEIHIEEIFN